MVKFVVALAAVCLLSGLLYQSSNSYIDSERDGFWQEASPLALYQLAKMGNEKAELALIQRNLTQSTVKWIESLANSGKETSALWLANNSQNNEERQRYFELAASKGNLQGMFELSLLEENTERANDLLRFSAQGGYVPAIIAYAKMLYTTGDAEDESTNWLEAAAKYDGLSALRYAKKLYRSNEIESSIDYFTQAKAKQHPRADFYLQAIQNRINTPFSYNLDTRQVRESSAHQTLSTYSNASLTNDGDSASAQSCRQIIQPVVFDIDGLAKAHELTQSFTKDARFSDIPICLMPPEQANSSDLLCEYSSRTKRALCSLKKFAEQSKTPQITHLLFIVDETKAYTQKGIMYLNTLSEYSVFVHELAHLSGFIDEYELSGNLAFEHCEKPAQEASEVPNLMYASIGTELGQAKLERWERAVELSQSDNVELAVSQTCQELDKFLLKPSNEVTFLEHHDTENIPPVYLAIWKQQLSLPQIALFESLYEASVLFNLPEDTVSHWRTLRENEENVDTLSEMDEDSFTSL